MIRLPADWRVYAVVLAGAAAALLYARGQVGAVNPLNRDNVFARAVDDVGAVLAERPQGDFSLGAWIWEQTHADAVFNGG